MDGVREARGFSQEGVKELFDGRVHLSAKALELGLIDAIGDLSEVVAEMREIIGPSESSQQEVMARARANINISKSI